MVRARYGANGAALVLDIGHCGATPLHACVQRTHVATGVDSDTLRTTLMQMIGARYLRRVSLDVDATDQRAAADTTQQRFRLPDIDELPMMSSKNGEQQHTHAHFTCRRCEHIAQTIGNRC
jgi:hypothetical protein